MAEALRLYKGPMITAAVLLVIGSGSLFSGFYLADLLNEANYYALVALGFILIITAATIFFVYGSMERRFRRITGGQALLDYTVNDKVYSRISGISSEDIKKGNRALLYVMLFFCAVMAVLGPLIVEDGILMTFIAVGIAAFLSLSEFMITRYRVNRMKRGSHRVVLAKCGAYVCGDFHAWCGIGLKLLDVKRVPDVQPVDGFSFMRIRYQALTLPGPSAYSVIIPVPDGQIEDAIESIIG